MHDFSVWLQTGSNPIGYEVTLKYILFLNISFKLVLHVLNVLTTWRCARIRPTSSRFSSLNHHGPGILKIQTIRIVTCYQLKNRFSLDHVVYTAATMVEDGGTGAAPVGAGMTGRLGCQHGPSLLVWRGTGVAFLLVCQSYEIKFNKTYGWKTKLRVSSCFHSYRFW